MDIDIFQGAAVEKNNPKEKEVEETTPTLVQGHDGSVVEPLDCRFGVVMKQHSRTSSCVGITETQKQNLLRVLQTDAVAFAVMEGITCPICRRVYEPKGKRSAKFLQCVHSFCTSCIRIKANNKHKIKCPICDEETYLERGDDVDLRENIHVRSVLVAASLQLEKGLSCSSCHNSTPLSGLTEIYLCKRCSSNDQIAVPLTSSLMTTAALDSRFQQMQTPQLSLSYPLVGPGSKRDIPFTCPEPDRRKLHKKLKEDRKDDILSDHRRHLMNNILLNEIDLGNALPGDLPDRSSFLNIEFALTDDILCTLLSRGVVKSHIQHWRGADWCLLIRRDPKNESKLSAYLGLLRSDDIENTFVVRLEIKFTFESRVGSMHCLKDVPFQHTFRAPDCDITGYVDIGLKNVFDCDEVCRRFWEDGNHFFRCYAQVVASNF